MLTPWRENIERVRLVIADYERITQTEGIDSAPPGQAFAALRVLTAQMEELERDKKTAEWAMTKHSARAYHAEQRVEELEAALRQLDSDLDLLRGSLHKAMRETIRAALAQSDPPEDSE